MSRKCTVNQGCMSLSTYYLEYGRHVGQLRRRRHRRRRCAYAPTSNTASHGNHEKINSWVSFSFPYEYGAPLGGPLGRRSSAIMMRTTYWLLKPSERLDRHYYGLTLSPSLAHYTIDHSSLEVALTNKLLRNGYILALVNNTYSGLSKSLCGNVARISVKIVVAPYAFENMFLKICFCRDTIPCIA